MLRCWSYGQEIGMRKLGPCLPGRVQVVPRFLTLEGFLLKQEEKEAGDV